MNLLEKRKAFMEKRKESYNAKAEDEKVVKEEKAPKAKAKKK